MLSQAAQRRTNLALHLNRGWSMFDIAEQEEVSPDVVRMDVVRTGPKQWVQGSLWPEDMFRVSPPPMSVVKSEKKSGVPDFVLVQANAFAREGAARGSILYRSRYETFLRAHASAWGSLEELFEKKVAKVRHLAEAATVRCERKIDTLNLEIVSLRSKSKQLKEKVKALKRKNRKG